MKSVDLDYSTDVGQEVRALIVLALLTAFLIWLLVVASPGMPDTSLPGEGVQEIELNSRQA